MEKPTTEQEINWRLENRSEHPWHVYQKEKEKNDAFLESFFPEALEENEANILGNACRKIIAEKKNVLPDLSPVFSLLMRELWQVTETLSLDARQRLFLNTLNAYLERNWESLKFFFTAIQEEIIQPLYILLEPGTFDSIGMSFARKSYLVRLDAKLAQSQTMVNDQIVLQKYIEHLPDEVVEINLPPVLKKLIGKEVGIFKVRAPSTNGELLGALTTLGLPLKINLLMGLVKLKERSFLVLTSTEDPTRYRYLAEFDRDAYLVELHSIYEVDAKITKSFRKFLNDQDVDQPMFFSPAASKIFKETETK